MEQNPAYNLPLKDRRRTSKPRYIKPDAVKELEQMVYDEFYKNKIIPEHCRVLTKYKDDTANGLTKCIVDYLKFKGAFATRLNSTGIYRADIKRFIPSNQKKGLGDILAVYNGLNIFIEVKVGRDRLSNAQRTTKEEIEQAGGIYQVAKDFTSFKIWFDEFINIEL